MSRKGVSSLSLAVLDVREGILDDAKAMGGLAYRIVDLDPARGAEECARILREPFAFSAVATRKTAGETPRLVGVVNGVLLRPWFSEHLLASEVPFFHNRVREAQRSPFPDAREVGRANNGEGLDLFLAHYAFDQSLDADEATRARLLLVPFFVERFAGNRLRCLLVETVGRENTALAEAAGWEVVTTFSEWRQAHGVLEREGPHLLRLTLDGAMGAANAPMARMLQYQPPALRFPSGARELLWAALGGTTDREYAEAHGVTLKSVDSAWGRIHRIVGRTLPELARPNTTEAKSGARRALLAYLRHYPEALWPYEGG